MKHVMMILCASLMSILSAPAFADTQGADVGNETTTTSGGGQTASAALCNCEKTGEPTLAMIGSGVKSKGVIRPAGVANVAPTGKGLSGDAEKKP